MAQNIVSGGSATGSGDADTGEFIYKDDFAALVQEIQEGEDVGYQEAVGLALSMVSLLADFVVTWDTSAKWQARCRK